MPADISPESVTKDQPGQEQPAINTTHNDTSTTLWKTKNIMFNAKQLLDQLLQGAQSMTTPRNTTTQQQGKDGLLSNPAVTGALSGVGGGLLAGLLLSNKKIRKIGGNVVAYGGAAALGAIAITAYRNWQANKDQPAATPVQPAPPTSQQTAALAFDQLPAPQLETHSRAMLAAVIAAAKADGHFDEREKQMIRDQVNQIGDAETVEWVQQEIRKPLDVNQIAALAISPEMAAEIYLASLVIIDEQNDREKIYLDSLAEQMKLPPPLRLEIARQLQQSSESQTLAF